MKLAAILGFEYKASRQEDNSHAKKRESEEKLSVIDSRAFAEKIASEKHGESSTRHQSIS